MLTVRMPESLKLSIPEWRWNEKFNEEFETLKKTFRIMKSTIWPNYTKEFVLKTDVSNVGLDAVLIRRIDGDLLPVQWASKKLSQTESRYGISEKEMLAIFWGVKKF